MLKRAVCAALLCLPLAACEETGTAPLVDAPTLRIADAAHNGDQHFFFLPPLAWMPEYSGTFDASLQPQVSICEVNGAVCDEIVTYEMGVEASGTVLGVDPDDEFYHLNWHTNLFELNVNSVYRIRVLVDGTELGYLDVLLVENKSKLRTGGLDGAYPLVDGRTAPIKFRIEEGLATNQQPDTPTQPNIPVPTIPEGAITGLVTDANGVGIEGILVTALAFGTPVSSVSTAADGGYVLPVADAYPTVLVTFEDPGGAYVAECYDSAPLVFCSAMGTPVARGTAGVDAVLNRVP